MRKRIPTTVAAVTWASVFLVGCAGPAPSATGGAAVLSDVEFAEPTRTSPVTSVTGEITRGALSWRAPAHWAVVDASSRPFVAGEYRLPGDAPERPAICVVSNGSAPKERTSEELRSALEKQARRFHDLRTVEGKSVRRSVRVEETRYGAFRWLEGRVEARFVDDGTVLDPRDPPLVAEGYAGRSAVPIEAGPPFVVHCQAPRERLEAESEAFEAWLGTFAVAPIDG